MDGVNYLNLEYILLRVYQIFTGVGASTSDLPSQAVALWGEITIAGLALAFILFVATVWVLIRTVIIEHEGFHKREEEERKRGIREEAKGNSRWERTVALASSGEEGDWRRAIIEADNMLDDLLTERGYLGETLGEKLKGANPLQFTTLDLAWQAHKVRNAIAHLGEAYPLSERETRATIDFYARVFEEFGIL